MRQKCSISEQIPEKKAKSLPPSLGYTTHTGRSGHSESPKRGHVMIPRGLGKTSPTLAGMIDKYKVTQTPYKPPHPHHLSPHMRPHIS